MPRALSFDEFTLDVSKGGVWRASRFQPLRPKTLALLLYLAENPSRLVTKDEIAEAVWPGVVATDESIAKCISELRAVLGDSEHRLLKTAPKRGYIFETTVIPLEDLASSKPTAVPTVAAASSRGVGLKAALFSALCVLVIVLGQLPNVSFSSKHAGPPSIAVLPFSQPTSDSTRAYLGDGLAEDLSVGLGKFPELFVIAHSSSARSAARPTPLSG